MSINSKMTALANAIRKKTGGTAALTLDGMATGLNNIPDNDASDVTVSGATVSIPKGNYLADVSKSVTNQGTKTATLNTSTTSYTIPAGYHSGSGKVSITLEEKSATPSTSAQTIIPTSGKVLSKVTVASIPSDYVPSGYVKPTATLAAKTYTPSTSAQTIAAGTYLSGVQTISAVPTQTKSATPSTSTQTITPDSGKFLSSVSVGAIATETKSVTPTTSAQDVTPTSGKYLTKVSVGAIPSDYIKPTATKAAATITPGTSNQTIVAGTYCSGAQTIAGDADLISANIKAGANIFGVAGNANVVDTSAGTATAAQILSGKIAFVDGKKITGTIATLSTDATGSGDGVHHTSEYNPHYGALSTGDTNKYVYTFIPPNNYIGSVNYIRVPEAKVADAVGIPAAKILSGTSILGVAGTFPTYSDQYIMSEGVTVGNYVAYKINRGAYTYDSTDDIVYIRSTKEQVATAIGLTAAKILKGNTILGISGTGVKTDTWAVFHTQYLGGYSYKAATAASAYGSATASSTTGYVTLPAGTYRVFGYGSVDGDTNSKGMWISKQGSVSTSLVAAENPTVGEGTFTNEFYFDKELVLSASTTVTLVMYSSATGYGRRGCVSVVRIS